MRVVILLLFESVLRIFAGNVHCKSATLSLLAQSVGETPAWVSEHIGQLTGELPHLPNMIQGLVSGRCLSTNENLGCQQVHREAQNILNL